MSKDSSVYFYLTYNNKKALTRYYPLLFSRSNQSWVIPLSATFPQLSLQCSLMCSVWTYTPTDIYSQSIIRWFWHIISPGGMASPEVLCCKAAWTEQGACILIITMQYCSNMQYSLLFPCQGIPCKDQKCHCFSPPLNTLWLPCSVCDTQPQAHWGWVSLLFVGDYFKQICSCECLQQQDGVYGIDSTLTTVLTFMAQKEHVTQCNHVACWDVFHHFWTIELYSREISYIKLWLHRNTC